MRNPMRTLAALAALLVVALPASAMAPDLPAHGGEAAASASAAAEHADGALEAGAGHDDLLRGGFRAWLNVRFTAALDDLRQVLGISVAADATVEKDGIEATGRVGDLALPALPETPALPDAPALPGGVDDAKGMLPAPCHALPVQVACLA